ncbi:Protein transport protein S9 plasma membrane t-SNARE [Savitreella phatthalungensis]
MKRFLSKNKDKSTDDADRSALFGGRSKQAQMTAEPVAGQASAPARQGSNSTQPPAYAPARNMYTDDPYSGDAPSYSAGSGQSGYPQEKLRDPYATSADPYAFTRPTGPRHGSGYLTRSDTATTQSQRAELFRGVQPDPRLEPEEPASSDFTQQQQATAEDEDEEVEGIKQEMRFVKQESVASTRNALRMAYQAEESGRATLSKLGQQSEALADAEKNLDLSKLHNRDAQVKARELKHLNRSMFAIQVNKPWGKNRRIEEDEARVQRQFEDDRYERDQRESVRKEAERRTDANLRRHAEAAAKGYSSRKMGLAERSRFQFEADEEDDEVEGEIDDNLDQLAAVTGRLKGLAMATNDEVTRQNQLLGRLDRKGEQLETDIFMNTNRLKRIERM